MNVNQRPGVYSSYSVSSRYAAPRALKGAALILGAEGLEAGLYPFGSYAEAAEALYQPERRHALAACRVLFESGVPRVYLSAAGEGGGCFEAAARVAENADVGALIAEASDEDDLLDLLDSVVDSSGLLLERLLFVGAGDSAGALRCAETLGHERGIVCCPAAACRGDDAPRGLYAACALAGAVLAEADPGARFSARALEPLTGVTPLPEREIQALIGGGVSVLELAAGAVECVRAVTSRARPDLSLRPLNGILIIDDVMRSLREGLKSLLRGMRAGAQSYESIATQAAILLAAKRDEGILSGFEPPRVRAGTEDPGVCVVDISFAIAHIVEQIHISAQIRL